jgi:peptide/nickel transport system permease protein
MLNVLNLIGRRLVQLPIMILGITFLVFFIMSFSKVDPALTALGEGASIEARQQYRLERGLDEPLLTRYVSFLGGLAKLDMGTYSARELPVIDEVAKAFPITLQLTFFGLVIAITFSLLLGVLAAIYRDRWPDQLIRLISIASLSTPSFWLAVLLIQLLGNKVGIFSLLPTSGRLPSITDNFGGWFLRMLLPAVALAIPVIGQLSRVVRTAVVEELDKDYVRTALGAGIPRHVVVGRNVLRNALITPITVLGLRVGYLLGGAVIIEIIFNINGMGMLIMNGVSNNEPNLIQGVTLTVALAFVVINVIVDLLYVLVNPRIRTI